MRKQYLFCCIIFLLIAQVTIAQNRAFPNAIHAKFNLLDYGLVSGNDLRLGQGFEIGYFRNVAPYVNVGIPFKLGLAKLPTNTENTVLTSLDVLAHFENTESESKLLPYAFVGAGYVLEQFKDGHPQFPFGGGVKYKVSDYAALNLQAEFRKAFVDDRDNIQLGLGFVYLLHKGVPQMSDADADGTPDQLDKCPDVAGPTTAMGCPDEDKDGVTDKDDQCPYDAGTINGCPDNDGDGVADKEDACPFDAGSVKGCPDADNDGIADKDDQCPTEVGRFNGCPDTDFDGIADKDDKCPTEAGTAENNGCPKAMAPAMVDSDNDGVADDKDQCPTSAGPVNGCPDGDGDGVADYEDQCPTERGDKANNGCPAMKDSDKDGVSDDKDQCPTAAGPVNGCPDGDGDGIADYEDQCPTERGDKANKGCPAVMDSDNDGVADKDDQCPTEAGSVNGCPDADSDGIADKDDKCPNERGDKANKGCPAVKDADKDGVPDDKDQCPTAAGPVNGCPDGDGDGIADYEDKCPTERGDKANKGCPAVKDADKDGVPDDKDQCPNDAGTLSGCPDSDKDGIADKDDQCPTTAGPASNNGCPVVPTTEKDSDADGVADRNDKCPNTPGVVSNFGCPEIKKETKERLAFATKAVQFESGKSILKNESYAVLDEMVGILRQYPDYTMSISGHTDDVGNDERNLELSKERAKACYDYLIFKGIKAERLRHAGFGENRPIANNDSPEGRELNRRVEFELILE